MAASKYNRATSPMHTVYCVLLRRYKQYLSGKEAYFNNYKLSVAIHNSRWQNTNRQLKFVSMYLCNNVFMSKSLYSVVPLSILSLCRQHGYACGLIMLRSSIVAINAIHIHKHTFQTTHSHSPIPIPLTSYQMAKHWLTEVARSNTGYCSNLETDVSKCVY